MSVLTPSRRIASMKSEEATLTEMSDLTEVGLTRSAAGIGVCTQY